MKVKCGGGGIDAEGNWFKLPEVECEVADDYFDTLLIAMQAAPERQTIQVSPSVMKMLREFQPS